MTCALIGGGVAVLVWLALAACMLAWGPLPGLGDLDVDDDSDGRAS